MIWLKYGCLKSDWTVIIVNAFGVVVSLASTAVYYKYSRERIRCEWQFFSTLIILFFIFYLSKIEWIGAPAIGCIGSGASIAMFAAPLISLVCYHHRRLL